MKGPLLLYAGASQEYANWVAIRSGNKPKHWEKFSVLAFGCRHDMTARVVWLYTSLDKGHIGAHVASNGKPWATPHVLQHVFQYPFLQLGARRISSPIRADNVRAMKAAESIGWKREGILREAEPDGCDVVLYGMLRRECRWLLTQETRNAAMAA